MFFFARAVSGFSPEWKQVQPSGGDALRREFDARQREQSERSILHRPYWLRAKDQFAPTSLVQILGAGELGSAAGAPMRSIGNGAKTAEPQSPAPNSWTSEVGAN